MINICFLDEYSAEGADLSALRNLGNYRGYDYTEPGEVVARSADADVVVSNKVVFSAAIMEQLPRLKLICVAATGTNNIDTNAAERLGIKVMNAVNYSAASVTEATFAGVLALLRQTLYYDRFVKSGDYAHSSRLFHFGRPMSELSGKRWGIIGMGNIGRHVAAVATAFGAQVAHYSPSGKTTGGDYPLLTLEEMLRTCDVVSIHAPLTPLTENLIDYPQLSLMKPTAILANMARGKIVNEEALARALNEGLLAGAVSDVYSAEPIREDNPLYRVSDPDRLILSPHNAWAAAESVQRLFDCVTANIRAHFGID